MSIQALILPALAALHNFIWVYNPQDVDVDVNKPLGFQFGRDPSDRDVDELESVVTLAETTRVNER